MKISTRARYGTRLLLDLALHYSEQPVLLKDIARRQEISLQYLQHLITPLVVGGIILTARGSRGGVSLARPPEEVRLSEVIRLLEGPIAPVECVTNPDMCARSSSCVTRDIWCGMQEAIHELLESTTLQDLAERQKNKESEQQTVYCI